MNCIIVDDEPLARKAIQRLILQFPGLSLIENFGNAEDAGQFIQKNKVDLIFLDINMPGVNGLEFAKTIPENTLVIFTTAYPQYALDSYEVDAIDYLIKPVGLERFTKAVNKAVSYHQLLASKDKETIEKVASDFIFVRSGRKFFKVRLDDILFVEGLKDYVIIQTQDKKIITRMYLKIIQEQLPDNFLRINKSYIINLDKIESFDTNDVNIGSFEVAIGETYRESFFSHFSSHLP